MAYSHRWLNRTRIQVNRLEDRLQPGSLLTGGVDLSAFEGMLSRPRNSFAEHLDVSVVSKPNSVDNEMQIIVSAADASETTAPYQAKETKTTTDSSSIVDLAQTSAPARAAVVVHDSSSIPAKRTAGVGSPAFHAPQSEAAVSKAAPVAVHSTISASVPHAIPAAETETHEQAKMVPAALNPAAFTLKVEQQECDGGGTKANFYNTYAGGTATDGYNAVGSAKAPILGESFAAGFQTIAGTPNGRITRYNAAGGCVATITVSAGAGVPVVATDIAVNRETTAPALINNVYVVGNIAGTAAAFIARFDASLTAFVGAPVILAAPAGGAISLDGVGLQCLTGGPNDVFATGYVNDPAVAAYDVTRVIRYNPALTVLGYSTNVVFAAASRGRTIDADRANNAYIGGSVIGTAAPNIGIQLALRSSLDPVAVFRWAVSTGTAGPVNDARTGWNGVDFLPGASAVGGLYMTGSTTDASNPGMVLQHIRRVIPSTGATFAGSGFLYTGGLGFDLSGEDIAVDRLGALYTAGYVGSAADRDALYIQFTNLGATITITDALGGVGTQDRGMGIDIDPSTNIYMVGSTDTPAGAMSPAPGGCQPANAGGTDGFAAAGSKPAPF